MKLREWLFRNYIKGTVFAKKLGISRTHLDRIIHNRSKPSPQLAIKIEKETNGAVTKEELRPDIFEQ